MRIIAFIQDPQETKKIMDSLGMPDFQPPAPLGTGPPGGDSSLSSDYFRDF
jgi:hypothetical protein